MQLGGSDFLAKPFGADDLRRKVFASVRPNRESGGTMSMKRRTGPIRLARPPLENGDPARASVDRLRQERLVYDGVTGLPVHPFEDPDRASAIERIERLGVVYLQIGKFFGFEELYGWELYDRVLVVVADGLREDVERSRLHREFVSLRYSGSDGFFVLFALPPAARSRSLPPLERLGAELQERCVRRLRQAFGGTTVDLMSVHVSTLIANDNPRVRPARHLIRNLSEAAKIVSQRQTREKLELCAELKVVIGRRKLRAAFQPVCHLPDGDVLGYEALIRVRRGPRSSVRTSSLPSPTSTRWASSSRRSASRRFSRTCRARSEPASSS